MLSLSNIALQKGSFTLKQVCLDVKDRDYFVILGRTGSGKTMLMETIAGLHKHSGTVSFRGKDLTAIPPEKRRIGFVYQDFALFPHLSVVQNIRFSDRYRKGSGVRDERWDELIDFLDLSHLLERDIRFLSGGEKQRVALARAIHSRPDILLLDEPLSAIDPSFRNTIMDNLKGLNHRFHMTVIHVTHNFREAAYLADNIGIMMDGALVQRGPVQHVLSHPNSVATARFLGFRNILPTALLGDVSESALFSVNPAMVHVAGGPLSSRYSLQGVCSEIKEDADHYKLLVKVGEVAVFVRIARQLYNPETVQVGATVYLGFDREAVTFFEKSETTDEVSV